MAITWTTVTFSNGAYGSAASSPDAGANTTTVRLRGQVTAKPGVTAWVQPGGSRPSVALALDCSDAVGRPVQLRIDTSGNASLFVWQNTANDAVTAILDGLTYAGEA